MIAGEHVATLHQASASGTSGFNGTVVAFDRLVEGLTVLDNELPLSVSESLLCTNVFSPVALPPCLGVSIPQG